MKIELKSDHSAYTLFLTFATALAPITDGDAKDSMKNCGKEENFLPQFFCLVAVHSGNPWSGIFGFMPET